MERIPVRLYYAHDLDLISLAEVGFPMTEVLRNVLAAYARKRRFLIQIPELPVRPDDWYARHKSWMIDLRIEDPLILKMLGEIKPKYRNSFIKGVLRCYLCHPYAPNYFNDPEAVKADQQERDQMFLQTTQY